MAGWLYPEGQSTHVVVTIASPVRYLPATQSAQSEAVVTANCPAAHLTHFVAPAPEPVVLSASHSVHDAAFGMLEYCPAGHSTHSSCATFPWDVPGIHFRQTEDPVKSWCHPVGQSRHVEASVSEPCLYRPAAHLSQFEPYSPALHGWHIVDPVSGAFEPTPQFLQVVRPDASEKVSAAQSVQLVLATSFWYLPGAQKSHADDDVAVWLLPAGQSTHVVVTFASPARYFPATHGLQSSCVLLAY